MALFFLPRFLKSGVATVPQYLEIRFDHQTQVITNLIFLVAYVGHPASRSSFIPARPE